MKNELNLKMFWNILKNEEKTIKKNKWRMSMYEIMQKNYEEK